MLILTRKVGQSIVVMIGGVKVIIAVTDINDRGRVKLGIEAPGQVAIVRTEILSEDEQIEVAKVLYGYTRDTSK